MDLNISEIDNKIEEEILKNLNELNDYDMIKFYMTYEMNEHLAPNILSKLAESKYSKICIDVALHPNTSQETLHKLSKNENVDVKCAVAHNKNTSIKTLENLAKEENINIQ